ncbi:TORTIFOLIA1-like protein 4 [Carica papaya]|uniref:TORTIFOLIA1-like protein 4 n=1 Tax=Carica papaya TaxID=3649 RepID=UPI000B8CA8C8|nr:TORTIFOLIA1-like protein 4 [Carica papaya]
MSRSPASPPTSQPQAPSAHDLKQRVITCLNKLADRDTLAIATAELESIARNLTQDSFSPFLNCIHNTDASSKSPVRKQCVNLLSLLCHCHGNFLSPHLSKMVSTLLRRIRDPDSAVRSACAVAAAAMSSCVTKPSFSVLSKPLIDTLTHDHDTNVQIGAALCLAAAVEAAPDPEAEQLRKVLPRLGKLLRSEAFKAKAALLGAIGSIVGAGGAGSKVALDSLVPCVTEFLSSEDWAARKAAAEALGKVVLAEEDLAPEYKKACLAVLESRRFDKVKIVRETMNRTLDLWKAVPGDSEEVSSSSPQSKSSPIDNGVVGCFPPVNKSTSDAGFKTPRPKKTVPTDSRSPPPSDSSVVTTAKKEGCLKNNQRNVVSSRLDRGRSFGSRAGIDEPRHATSEISSHESHTQKSDITVMEVGEIGNSRPEVKRVLFNEKVHKFGGLKSGSRVVPCNDDEISDAVVPGGSEEVDENQKDAEDLSLIREQLAQIETQQSDLLDLLQRFIGSSQSGIHSLESRVNGLEMALDEMSYDLGLTSGRIQNGDGVKNTCCKLPGAEFLSSKFWRRTECRFSNSRFFSSVHMPPGAASNMLNKDTHSESYKADNQRFQQESKNALTINMAADVCRDLRGHSGFYTSRKSKNVPDTENLQVYSAGRLDGASSATYMASMNLSGRFSA